MSVKFYKKEKVVFKKKKNITFLVDIAQRKIYNIDSMIRRCKINGYKSVAKDTVRTFRSERVGRRQGQRLHCQYGDSGDLVADVHCRHRQQAELHT